MSYTKKQVSKWKGLLPEGAAVTIHEEIKKVITLRQVFRILAGISPDKYGVEAIALRLAKKHQKQQEKIARELTLLKLNSSTPNKK